MRLIFYIGYTFWCCTQIFRGFEKYRDSNQNPMGLAFGFTKKTYVRDENWSEIRISML
jgi:hypothetical protein